MVGLIITHGFSRGVKKFPVLISFNAGTSTIGVRVPVTLYNGTGVSSLPAAGRDTSDNSLNAGMSLMPYRTPPGPMDRIKSELAKAGESLSFSICQRTILISDVIITKELLRHILNYFRLY